MVELELGVALRPEHGELTLEEQRRSAVVLGLPEAPEQGSSSGHSEGSGRPLGSGSPPRGTQDAPKQPGQRIEQTCDQAGRGG